MTPIAGFALAVVAGWLVADARRAALTIVTPWLAVLIVQTWYIEAGKAVSPPSSVNPGYWIFQAVALGSALGIAIQLAVWRSRRAGRSSGRSAGRVVTCVAAQVAITAVLIFAYLAGHSLFEPGSAAHHETGKPPVVGIAGLLLCVAGCVVLRVVSRGSRRRGAVALSA